MNALAGIRPIRYGVSLLMSAVLIGSTMLYLAGPASASPQWATPWRGPLLTALASQKPHRDRGPTTNGPANSVPPPGAAAKAFPVPAAGAMTEADRVPPPGFVATQNREPSAVVPTLDAPTPPVYVRRGDPSWEVPERQRYSYLPYDDAVCARRSADRRSTDAAAPN